MSPRYLGCRAVVARSIARIHETNLKKQGVLCLTFADPKTWEQVRETDRISITGLGDFTPGRPLYGKLIHASGGEECFELRHSYNEDQVRWFQAGGALNLVR